MVNASTLPIAEVMHEWLSKGNLCLEVAEPPCEFLQYGQVCRPFQIKHPSSLLGLDEIFESNVPKRL